MRASSVATGRMGWPRRSRLAAVESDARPRQVAVIVADRERCRPSSQDLIRMPAKAARTAWKDSSCGGSVRSAGRVGAGEMAHHHHRPRRLAGAASRPHRRAPRPARGRAGSCPVSTWSAKGRVPQSRLPCGDLAGAISTTGTRSAQPYRPPPLGQVAVEDEDPGVGCEPAGCDALGGERDEEVPAARRRAPARLSDAETVAVGLDHAAASRAGPSARPASRQLARRAARSIVSRPPAPASTAPRGPPRPANGRWALRSALFRIPAPSRAVLRIGCVGEVGEAGEFGLEGEVDRAGRAVALLGDDHFGLALAPGRISSSIRRISGRPGFGLLGS